MCWKCDHPEVTVEEWLESMRSIIDTHGWAVQYVESEHRPFAYTVGLHERGLPELLVTGLPPSRAVEILNTVAAYLVDGGRPVPGDLVTIADGPSLEVVQVQHPDAHLLVAIALYGDGVRALQVVWDVRVGHRPLCPDFNRGGVRQPVLGVRGSPP